MSKNALEHMYFASALNRPDYVNIAVAAETGSNPVPDHLGSQMILLCVNLIRFTLLFPQGVTILFILPGHLYHLCADVVSVSMVS